MATISAANTVLILSCPGLGITAQIQGFPPDSAITVESLDNKETMMGVDGFYTAGFVFVPVRTTFHLNAAAPSNSVFETIYNSELAILDAYPLTATFNFPGLRRKYRGAPGFLRGYKPFADAAKVMQPREYMIEWGSLVGVQY